MDWHLFAIPGEPIRAAFGPITQAPKLRSSAIAR
jgi:hypothetical protein